MNAPCIKIRGSRHDVEALISELRTEYAQHPIEIGTPAGVRGGLFGRTPHRHAELVDVVIMFGIAIAPTLAKEIIKWLKKRSAPKKVSILDDSSRGKSRSTAKRRSPKKGAHRSKSK